MRTVCQSFLLLLAQASDRPLARYLQFLKAENRILRGKLPARIAVTPRERRRLLKFGRPLDSALKDLITIVSPRTFARWAQAECQPATRCRTRKPGRLRTADDLRDLILRLARENCWGYTRILGALKKLGIRSVSRSTVVNILKENGLDPGPKRGEGTWDEFHKRHAQTLWTCDFFSQKVWTLHGLVDIFVLFFIHIGTRRVHLAGTTTNPDSIWTVQQARNISIVFADEPVRPQFLIRDMDSKFARDFDAILTSDGIEVVKVGPRKPNLNAIAERFVQTVRQECLDHFVFFGETHFRHVLTEFLAHYHGERPHQGLGNRPLSGRNPPDEADSTAPIGCAERLGGLLKHYYRAAA